MKKIVIKNCNDYKIFEDVVFRIDIEKKFWINNLKINEGCFSFSGQVEDLIFLFEENKFKTYAYDFTGTLKIKIEDYALILKHKFYSGKYLTVINNGKDITWNLYDLEENKVIQDYSELGYNGFNLVIDDSFFITKNKKKIGLFNFENEVIWQHSYIDLLNEENTTISTEIVEVSGVVYFLLHGGGKHECFGLDANTGKVVKRIPNIVGDIIVENEFIYFLHSEVITIYNTQKGEIITWEIEDLMVETGIERLWFPRWAIHDELIYFSQSKGADRNSDNIGARFGVLDPTKKELLWQDKLPLENGIIGSIKVNQNRIYLHTQDQTLFIYEKE